MDTEEADTPGSRLRAFIDGRWGRRQGGILGLCRQLNISTETMYEWFRNEREPNLDHLTRLAEALGDVKRWEVLAAMDGDAPIRPLDAETRQMVREEIEAALARRREQP